MNCRLKAIITSLVLAALGIPLGAAGADDGKPDDPRVFRAGAFAIDITPTKLPVIVSGSSLESSGRTKTWRRRGSAGPWAQTRRTSSAGVF